MAETQHGIKYATHIITNHFGNLVAKVCQCLLRKGPLTVQKVVEFTELNQTQVKNSLLVLIQHNCVQAYRSGDDLKLTTHYIALFDNILHRVRFSKFLAIISQDFHKSCVDIVEGLLEHGRLTVKQIVDRANSSQKEGNSIGLDSVKENLCKLVNGRYIEHCPASEPVLAPPTEEEDRAKKRSAKSAKIVIESETLEQRVLAVAVPMDAKRFSVDLDTELKDDAENDQNKSSDKHVGDKRKLDASEPNIDGEVAEDQVVLWRANFEEFIRRLRHKACIENVRGRLDDGAAIVLSAMLDASRTEEKKVKTASSVPLSLNSIYEEVIKNENGRNMTIDHIESALGQLGSPPPFVKAVEDLYTIDFKHIIEAAQSDEVESIVLKRYGRDAYRIFRLLSKASRLLETDKISDTIFVEKKETTKILYKMWQDDYLLMEKLVAGTATFLLWKVNKHTLWKQVLDEMFHASLNLSIRVAYELEQQKEILNFAADKREGLMKEKYENLRKMRFLMESSQMKLDDAIMLFHDF
ncbi:DNA-directed RNA polymerase III subunit rpc-3 [Ricinus communis]|uniref:DNA-directed RNA polymerase III subunit rpc-3 n=1 Tax=Ricinus communis TaxID=3988 RepID=UPI00201A2895|nr:DNA-directed RNA polymerase III subunit rpc-3 [Ricinus communis]